MKPGPKTGRVGVAVIAAVFAALVGWREFRAHERQKQLAAWIGQYSASREAVERDEQWGIRGIRSFAGREGRQIDKAAESGIRGLGSVPMFLAMLEVRETPFRVRLAALVDHLPWLGLLFLENTRAYEARLEDSRRKGAYGLVGLGNEARTAVPELIQLIKDGDERIRFHAIFVLRCLGPEAGDAVPALAESLKDPYVSTWAVTALGVIHQRPQEVVPLLV